MEPGPVIRVERAEDHGVLGDLIQAAFAGQPYADGDEHELPSALRKAGALHLSLVAEQGGQIVGQAAFSPAQDDSGEARWFALGPIAVLPAWQGRGIGSRLVRRGLDILQQEGAAGCILVGEPAYYARFGFRLAPAHTPKRQPPEYFQVRRLADREPNGRFRFHPLFG